MSQEYSKRIPSRFQPELDANKLVAYTTHILTNRKYFPEETQMTIIPKIIEEVVNMAVLVNFANSIDVRENAIEAYKQRVMYQSKALNILNGLKQKIKIFKLGYNLAGHKAVAWNREVDKVIVSVTSWSNSEQRKIKDLGGSL